MNSTLNFASDCRLLINRELIVDSLRLLIVDSSPWAELFSPHYNAASETTQIYFTLKQKTKQPTLLRQCSFQTSSAVSSIRYRIRPCFSHLTNATLITGLSGSPRAYLSLITPNAQPANYTLSNSS